MRSPTCRASETAPRLSAQPEYLRGEARTSQVPGPSSSYVPWSNTPPDTFLSSPMITERSLLPSGNSAPWASGKRRGFGAAYPMAHTFACLRIAEAIADPVARLATGSGGLTLGRTGFAPAGRQTKFHEGIVSSLPFDQHCLVALNFLSAHDVLEQQHLSGSFRLRGRSAL